MTNKDRYILISFLHTCSYIEKEYSVTREQLKSALQIFFKSLAALLEKAIKAAKDKVGEFTIKSVVKAGACSRIWNFDHAVQNHMKTKYEVRLVSGKYLKIRWMSPLNLSNRILR